MSLESKIAKWDRKSAADIGTVHEEHCVGDEYVSDLVQLIVSNHLVHGATWLLKAAAESGIPVQPDDVEKIYSNLNHLDHWEEKLHILQCIEFLPIPKGQQENANKFLRSCLTQENKFVRAWAYSGLYYLARQHHEYRDEVSNSFKVALRDEAPSVKARIRKIAKHGF